LVTRWLGEQHSDALARVSRYAETMARSVDRELTGYVDTAELLAASRQLQEGDVTQFDRLARDAARKTGGQFILVDRNMQQLVNTRAEPDTPLPQTSNPDAAKHVFDSAAPSFGNLSRGAISHQLNFAVRVPVEVSGEIRYVLSYIPPADSILEIVRQSFRSEGWLAAVVDGAGRIVARSASHAEFYGKSASSGFIAQSKGDSGIFDSVDLEGRPSVTAFHRSGLSNWRMVVWAPKSILYASRDAAVRGIAALIAAALAMSFLAAWMVGRIIGQPARRLAETATAVGEGRTVTFEPTLMTEANVIGRALVDASNAIARREVELRTSEARFRKVYEHAPIGIALTDMNGRYQRCNPALREMLGYSEEELLGREFTAIMRPEDIPENIAQLRRLITGQQSYFEIENRFVHKDGRLVWCRKFVSLLPDPQGRPANIMSLIVDTTDQKRAEAALHASEDRYRSMVRLMPAAMYTCDPAGRITYFNDNAAMIWGTAPKIGASKEELMHSIRMLSPDGTPLHYSETPMAKVLQSGDVCRNEEVLIERPDGSRASVLINIDLIRSEDGTLLEALSVFFDITDRKRHEEQIQLLVREVHHRAKNMLSVVQAIAGQLMVTDPKDFTRRFSERISALAASQDLFVKGEWNGVDMSELVRSQLAHFKDLIGPRIRLDGPPLHISASACQTIGMALYELATNAGKFGSLSNDAGTVDIVWRRERASGGEDRFSIRWVERGGPPVQPPERRGFGSKVLGVVSRGSLGAEVDLIYAVEGLEWHLTCPAAKVLEQKDLSAAGIARSDEG